MEKKEKNGPVLFIDSIQSDNITNSSQQYFDSRYKKSNKNSFFVPIKKQIENICSLVNEGKEVKVLLKLESSSIEGYVTKYQDDIVQLKILESQKEIPVDSIKDIIIL